MNELKTLQDLRGLFDRGCIDWWILNKDGDYVEYKQARNIAIKHINSVSHLDCWTIPTDEERIILNALPWIKKFFNIK